MHTGKERMPAADTIRGNRIGLFGGAFNPPHLGHFHAAQTALTRLNLHSVWWILNDDHPTKPQGDLAPLDTRFEMLRKFTSQRSMVPVFAQAHRGSYFTFDLVSKLANRYGGTRFVWILGADQWRNFHTWYRWYDLAQRIPITIIDRKVNKQRVLASPAATRLWLRRNTCSTDLLLLRPPAWQFIHARRLDMSSSDLRLRERS